jgi:hypothetical protein
MSAKHSSASALYGSPILGRINWSGAARPFTVRLVRLLEDYGELEAGRPAIIALLEELREQVGDDRKKEINQLISEFDSPAPLADITPPDKTFEGMNYTSSFPMLDRNNPSPKKSSNS